MSIWSYCRIPPWHLLRRKRLEWREGMNPLFAIKRAGDPVTDTARKPLLGEDAPMRKQISHNGKTHHILKALRPNNVEENFASNRKRSQSYPAHKDAGRATWQRLKGARIHEMARDQSGAIRLIKWAYSACVPPKRPWSWHLSCVSKARHARTSIAIAKWRVRDKLPGEDSVMRRAYSIV